MPTSLTGANPAHSEGRSKESYRYHCAPPGSPPDRVGVVSKVLLASRGIYLPDRLSATSLGKASSSHSLDTEGDSWNTKAIDSDSAQTPEGFSHRLSTIMTDIF